MEKVDVVPLGFISVEPRVFEHALGDGPKHHAGYLDK